MISKILIANRGEIACRIIESVQSAGYDAVAVHSEADSDALFMKLADESVNLGGNTSAESYLDMDKVINAAKVSGADAIHPGYGFLSENPLFSAKCQENEIIFIGPAPHAIEVMGNKAEAKKLMQSIVPCIPGYEGTAQDNASLLKAAETVGFPLMVKAAAGGGGRGIRKVDYLSDLESALESARTESKNAFGSDELILEKSIENARHIEIQIAADQHGSVIHLFERDCSAQRRHQKVIEEAPSPFMTEELRKAMGDAAVKAAKAVEYHGVGTVEFLVDEERNFYFLEMNTRLQVEHPVTEMITDIDLVDWQLQIAVGDPLPLTQDEITINGHSIEVRIYAEDPAKGFMPQTGTIRVFQPSDDEGVRTDYGVLSGSVITPYYDSMLAKIISWGKDREEARRRLVRALKNTTVLGLTTNKTFLVQLLGEQEFIAGETKTSFISGEVLERANKGVEKIDLALAAVLLNQNSHALNGWSNTEPMLRTEKFLVSDKKHLVAILQTTTGYEVTVDDQVFQIDRVNAINGELSYNLDGVMRRVAYSIIEDQISIDLGERVSNILRTTHHAAQSADAAGSGQVKAATEGLVVDILVQPGDKVVKGDTLVIVEAMKMEHRHLADGDGTVETVGVEKGQQAKNRQLLVALNLTKGEGE